MDANNSSQSWRQALGSEIRRAREELGISQEALGKAIGKSRNIIIRYEAGRTAPSVNVLGRIASHLSMSEVSVNGYRFFVREQTGSATPDSKEQFKLDFDKEHVYPGAEIRITPTKFTLTITAVAPEPRRSPNGDAGEKAS